MDLCWTSTSASAGEDFTIRAEWRSMALKVGYKALCNNNNKKNAYCSELSDQNFESCKSKLLGIMEKRGKQPPSLSWQSHNLFEILVTALKGYPGLCEVMKPQAPVKGVWLYLCWNVYYVSILSSTGSHRWHSNHRPVGLCDGCIDVEHKVE